MPNELRQFIEGVLLVIGALLPIVNPFGGAPVFLAMTADCPQDVRRALAGRVAMHAFLLLAASLFVGRYVLEFFGLSVPIVQVAGGVVVCGLGWDLLQHGASTESFAAAPGDSDIGSRAFYPLTLPLTVGPGSISVAVTIGANHAQQGVRSLVVSGLAELIGVTLVAATILVCYRYADWMLERLGSTGTNVLVRLSAFILLCIGVQIFWNGASALVDTLPLVQQK